MENKRILVLDHQPDKQLFADLARDSRAEITYAAGYLQAVAMALRVRPQVIYVRRDLPWLRSSLPVEVLFSGMQVTFYMPNELRGDLPSSKMHRPIPSR